MAPSIFSTRLIQVLYGPRFPLFEGGADEANATVSRKHAHVTSEAGEYCLSDDASEFGTRVFRNGRSLDVPSGNRRGEKLKPGDEIYPGRACLRLRRRLHNSGMAWVVSEKADPLAQEQRRIPGLALSEGFLYHSPNLGKHSCALALRACALGDVGGDDDGRLAGRPQHSDVVGRMLAVRASLIGGAPVLW